MLASWNTGNLAVLLIFGLPVAAVIGYWWYRIEKVKSDNDLKQRMIDHGMSIDDMERLLKTPSDDEDDD